MSDTVIQVENLSKKYILGHQQQERYTALRDVITNQAKNLLSPFQNQKSKITNSQEEFWALKDVSFEIKQGDRVGIIGRNGAGKSTLLKILSRITEPTKGRINIKGRVASLLEVGTGFHPELTGRENIYLNGAILGMSKIDIQRKFDEIVAFAEVEKFLDTPVKRYSSGMYVRLAFAVAAHLEPEILIVDEVLAVGDAQFQNKCLDRMENVSQNEGRTVIFVSHNMAAIKSLTSTCCILDAGKLLNYTKTPDSLEFYQDLWKKNITQDSLLNNQKIGNHTKFLDIKFLDKNGKETKYYNPGDNLFLSIDFYTDGTSGMSLEIFIEAADGFKIALCSLYQFHQITLPTKSGNYHFTLQLQPLNLASGLYSLELTTSLVNSGWDCVLESAVSFEVLFSNPLNFPWNFKYNYGYGGLALLCFESPNFVEI